MTNFLTFNRCSHISKASPGTFHHCYKKLMFAPDLCLSLEIILLLLIVYVNENNPQLSKKDFSHVKSFHYHNYTSIGVHLSVITSKICVIILKEKGY